MMMSENETTTDPSNSNQLTRANLSASANDHVRASGATNTLLSVPRQQLRRRTSANSLVAEPRFSESAITSTDLDSGSDEQLLKVSSKSSSVIVATSKSTKWRAVFDDFWTANYGAFLIVVAQIFGCGMTVSTRLLEIPGSHGKPMDPFQILFVRQSITVLLCTVYALWAKSIPHFPLGQAGTVRWLLASRGFFGFLGVFGLYFSLQYLPLSEASILTFLAPVGTCYAFSLLLPGETFTRRQQMAAFLSLLGVVFIARPTWLFKGGGEDTAIHGPDSIVATNSTVISQPDTPQPTPAQHLQAIGVAMIGVVGGIGAMTSIRRIGQRAHPFLSVFYFSALCAIVSLMAILLIDSVEFRLPGNFIEWTLLLIISICGFLTQWLITVGMAYGASTSPETTSTIDVNRDLEMQSWSNNSDGTRVTIRPPTTPLASQQPDRRIPETSKASGSKAVSMFYLSLLFSLVSDKVIFGITPVLWSWIGSGLILAGAIWVAAEGAKSKVSLKERVIDVCNQNQSYSSKIADAVQEEEVGLLRDVDDLDADQDDTPPQAVVASSSSNTTVMPHVELPPIRNSLYSP